MSETLGDIMRNRAALEKQASVLTKETNQKEATDMNYVQAVKQDGTKSHGMEKLAAASADVYQRKLNNNFAIISEADAQFVKEANGNPRMLAALRQGFQKIAAEQPEKLGLKDANPTEEEVVSELEKTEGEAPLPELSEEDAVKVVDAVNEMIKNAVAPGSDVSASKIAPVAEKMFSDMIAQGVAPEVVAGAVVAKAVEADIIPAEAAEVAMEGLATSFEETKGDMVAPELGVSKEASVLRTFAAQVKSLV